MVSERTFGISLGTTVFHVASSSIGDQNSSNDYPEKTSMHILRPRPVSTEARMTCPLMKATLHSAYVNHITLSVLRLMRRTLVGWRLKSTSVLTMATSLGPYTLMQAQQWLEESGTVVKRRGREVFVERSKRTTSTFLCARGGKNQVR
jgi:hypothetical protein